MASNLSLTVPCPVTSKILKAYFCVYSPKLFDELVHSNTLSTLESSPHALCTIEWGDKGNHKHANYFFYSFHKDAYNVARARKWKKPEFLVKAVTNIANTINYMTKEGKSLPVSCLSLPVSCQSLPVSCQSLDRCCDRRAPG